MTQLIEFSVLAMIILVAIESLKRNSNGKNEKQRNRNQKGIDAMQNAKLLPPWIIYFKKIEAMFQDDPDIKIAIQDEQPPYEIKLRVSSVEKANALTELLPAEKIFGNVSAKVTVVPANVKSEHKIDTFLSAFDGNPAFAFVKGDYSGPFDMNYVVFAKKVVQYHADDAGDIYGLCSTLYEDIARDIFEDCDGIYFCTDVE